MAAGVKPRREYRSEHRAERARQTRGAIVHAARQCFIERGYGATTLQQVATRAAVSVQTVYAVFGTKQALLSEVLDRAIAGDDRPVAVNDRDWMKVVWEASRARDRARAYAAACRRIMEGAGDVFAVVQEAAAADPAMAALAVETARRRRVGAEAVVNSLASVGGLRPGLELSEAADRLWTLNSPEVFRLLVRGAGWTLDAYQEWLAEAIVGQLLGPPLSRARTPPKH